MTALYFPPFVFDDDFPIQKMSGLQSGFPPMYLYDSTMGQKLETVPWLSLSLKICKTVCSWRRAAEERQPGQSPEAWVLEQRGKGIIKHNLFN